MPQPTSDVSRAVVGQVPKALRLESIKSRIVGLALLATLMPSLGMAWISYVQSRAALTDKITEELQSVSEQTAREIDLWVKERLYDVRVFASSYEVTENIDRARRSAGRAQAGARLNNYLTSVEERFPDYNELLVIDQRGQPLATSADRPGDVHLPPGWLDRVAADQTVIGGAYWDEQLGQRFMTVAVPVTAADRTFVGALVANVSYRAVLTILLVFAPGESGNMYVIAPDGTVIIGSGADAGPIADRRLESATTQFLFASEGSPVTYSDRDGNEVIGTLKRVPRLDWAVVAEIPLEEAYAQVEELRDVTVILVMGLLILVGFIAYRLSLLIVRPLDRLTTGAAEVAAGDLAVDLPVGKGEVGYLTEVFNGMVARLREGRQQLEVLLVNRPAHRDMEPPASDGDPGERNAPCEPFEIAVRDPDGGCRPFQEVQRHARPHRGRRGPQGCCGGSAGGHPRDRSRRALRGGGIPGRAPGHGHRRRDQGCRPNP